MRVCFIDFKGNWDNDYLSSIEFAYKNSCHSSIGMGLFKALCGRRCRFLIIWFEVGEVSSIGPK